MYKFDNAVNLIMEKLILEETEESDVEKAIDDTINQIQQRLQNDPDGYREESIKKYENDSGITSKVQNFISKIKDSVKEESEEEPSTWSKVKEFGKGVLHKASETLGPTLSNVGDWVADNIGEFLDKTIGEEYITQIQKELSETFFYKLVAVFEPTGIMSWPYYRNALDLYEKNKGTEDEDIYFLNLLAAQISIIPGVRLPLGILTFPLKLITKPIGLVFGNKSRTIARAAAKYVRKPISESALLTKAAEKTGVVAKGTKASKALAKGGSKLLSAAKKPVKSIARGVSKVAKPIAKTAATAAKVGTVVSSGDIPETIKKWSEEGQKDIGKPMQRTLGSFPSFGGISTQRF